MWVLSATRSSTNTFQIFAQGDLEGLQPSENSPFLVVVAGFASYHHQKKEILGRQSLPKPRL